ncbi:MAG: hypothetical protein GTO63_02860 [Anaerolineae bacterium]|nr:hypothetical protein [Anaerolineae bacterium]NIN93977.1 hypothetical protein [Anaerolineae bacterium]
MPKARPAGGGETTRRIASAMLVPFALSLILAFTPTASAPRNVYATSMNPPTFTLPVDEPRLSLLAPCYVAIFDQYGPPEDWVLPLLPLVPDQEFTAGIPYYVAHGWLAFIGPWPQFQSPWDQIPSEYKRAFMSRATTFELEIDGVLQRSSRHAAVVNVPDFGLEKFKIFVTEDPDGLAAGPHDFVGRWFLDAAFQGGEPGEPVLAMECAMNVNFN